MEKNKGITLIALVITIIVMLILVAVIVNILIKNNLIGTAEKTVNKYKTVTEDEENGEIIEIGGKKYKSIDDYINNKPISTIKISMTVINQDTEITIDGTNVKSIEQGVPIPVGYYYVGGTKNTGVVISDNSEDANRGDSHEVATTLKGNQFVWVPVLQNQKIKIEIVAEEEITEIKIEDPRAVEITQDAENNDIIANGKTKTSIINPTTNGEYTLTVKTANDTNTATLYVKSLYAQDMTEPLEKFLMQIEKTAKEKNISEDEAAAILTDNTCKTAEEAIELTRAMGPGEDDNIDIHKDSVNQYGGFYIARYEAGSNTKGASSGDTDEVFSQANKYPFYYINQIESIAKAAKMNNGQTSVTASLINSAVWDRTLCWLEETKAVTRDELTTNSSSWGNYFDAEIGTIKPKDKAMPLKTGETEYTCRNNIYDLAGNYREWTTEDGFLFDMETRGGSNKNNAYEGNNYAFLRVEYAPKTDGDEDISFRSALYIN